MIRSIFISLCLLAVTASPALSQDARLRTGGGGDRVVASDDFEATVFARRLGHVSAVARHADGTLYSADQESGRIFRIQDRGMDGVADITQPLPHRFDRPTGLAVLGDILFVADRGGLWRMQPGGGTPALIAPFVNSGSTGIAHPIIVTSPNSLLLGLSRTDGSARLLTIDTRNGSAAQHAETRGQIIGFATASDTKDFPAPWILLRRDDAVLFGSSLDSARDIGVEARAVWIDAATGQARIALPDGVYATIATFTGLKDKGVPILTGFGGDARPGAMVSDERGLFVADQAGGRLWRVSPKPAPKPTIVTPDLDATATDLETVTGGVFDPVQDRSSRPELMRGSGIGSASTIGPASTMSPASSLPEADQPRSASDPETASEPRE
ncbi:hypothetical protein GCM10009069_27940 [Algimonas arctica]|uniref:Uncharacterized protein n=1 Tax=Algimonas arctica TaxID=1479486 RepID=A0A8J3CS11_9PROT|nr:hypothetical protein [Algimonas arctica]GHB03694.1 hypothetical protein GCM10009069_27940 [Algimonas arctica]